jgi:Glycosyltransferase family 87
VAAPAGAATLGLVSSLALRRPWLLRALALAVAVFAAVDVVLQVREGVMAPARTDWLPFATGGRLLQSDPSCLYCVSAQASTQAGILGYVPAAGFPQPFVNPPLTALLLRPLAGLPLATGMALFVLLLLGGLAVALRVGGSLLPHAWPREGRVVALAAFALSIPAATALLLAQWAPLLLLAALLALVALRRGRAVLAGLLLAVLLVQPQTVWLVVPLLAVAGSWRVLIGFGAGAAGWVLSGLALVGPAQLVQWPQLVLGRQTGEAHRTVGLPGMVAEWLGRDGVAFPVAVALALLAVGGAVLLRGRLRGRADVAVACGIALSLVCAPHVFPDDLMLLAATAVVWAPHAPRRAVALGLLLSPAYELDGVLPLWLAHCTTLVAAAVALGACRSLLARRGNQAVVTRSQALFGLVIEPAPGG